MFRLRRAFTLIELLVVVAIIAVLASILFPVFARARENARRASCASNLRQINLGLQQYIQDYDERIPNAQVGPLSVGKDSGWMFYKSFDSTDNPGIDVFEPSRGAVFSYVKSEQIFVCPSDTLGQASRNSYAINGCTMEERNGEYARGRSLAAFEESSRFALLIEEGTLSGAGSTDDGYYRRANNFHSARHLEGSSVSFLDGHTKWYRPERILADNLMTGGKSGADADALCAPPSGIRRN